MLKYGNASKVPSLSKWKYPKISIQVNVFSGVIRKIKSEAKQKNVLTMSDQIHGLHVVSDALVAAESGPHFEGFVQVTVL